MLLLFNLLLLTPAIGAGFSNGIVFEFKTSHAAPVTAVSAWDITEREMLINRNAKFKVSKVLFDVPYERKDNKLFKYCVIQLEEA